MTRLFVPGRIEVLGKHTDYAGGRSLLAAVDRGFTVDSTPTDDRLVTVVDTARGETVRIPVPDHSPAAGSATGPAAGSATGPAAGSTTGPASGSAAGPASASQTSHGRDPAWTVYPRTVIRRLARDFPGRLRGCRIDLASDLPAAAGLSSSSALVTAIFLALDAAWDLSGTDRYRQAVPDRETLAAYLGAIERGAAFPALDTRPRQPAGPAGRPHDRIGARPRAGGANGVGTRGGSEDHVAILCAESGRLVHYRFEPVRREGVVPFPAGHVFVIATSGVVAEKTGAARERYNRQSDLASRAAGLWRTATGQTQPHLAAILDDAGPERLLEVVGRAAEPDERAALVRRVRHFAIESGELVPAAAEALAAGDLERFGATVDRSQALAEELLANQVPETVRLARTARELGAVAASSFGAGFGGSVWALVPDRSAARFVADWQEAYRAAFPSRVADAAFFTTPPAAPARFL